MSMNVHTVCVGCLCVCADELIWRLSPQGTALVNNSDVAYYQGNADFILIAGSLFCSVYHESIDA